MHPPQSFLDEQRRFPRYRAAEVEKAPIAQELFSGLQLPYPPEGIFLRVFKKEQLLELWGTGTPPGPHRLVRVYPITAISGKPGPKRREDDGQTPEGFYRIARFNPASKFHLSLGLNYPNRSDRILGDKSALGRDIFIHGGWVTMGCVPITDDLIKELYVIAVAARANGQEQIPVHIFPRRLDAAGLRTLEEGAGEDQSLLYFWKNLMVGYNLFETTRMLPVVSVAPDGRYLFRPGSAAAADSPPSDHPS
jgi:murein L,D-transpeptidase YafK